MYLYLYVQYYSIMSVSMMYCGSCLSTSLVTSTRLTVFRKIITVQLFVVTKQLFEYISKICFFTSVLILTSWRFFISPLL
jgi:hypothetical protein